MKFFVIKVNGLYPALKPADAIFLIKMRLIQFRILKPKMSHVNIHEGRSTKRVGCFTGNKRNIVLGMFSDETSGGKTADSIAENCDMHEYMDLLLNG